MALRHIAGILFFLVILCATVLVVHRGIDSPLPEYALSSSTSSVQHVGSPQSTASSQHPSAIGASATIDLKSLTTNSANPTITGTASDISEIIIIISKGTTTPAAQYDGPGSVRDEVWGYASGNPGFSLSLNGHWSAHVDYREHIPVLQQGIYTVAVYGNSLLTYGYLIVH